eukprot:TRINITY_DN6409_c0_g1_i2.p1 TRINITY_DN6409_c0_g1~~TRINITY_DN6409_c0_g1_i2.p1  ORF type:complete len:171 (-),score=60.74 TRINITY_DN6409_c0_g1_i2:100-567(-)
MEGLTDQFIDSVVGEFGTGTQHPTEKEIAFSSISLLTSYYKLLPEISEKNVEKLVEALERSDPSTPETRDKLVASLENLLHYTPHAITAAKNDLGSLLALKVFQTGDYPLVLRTRSLLLWKLTDLSPEEKKNLGLGKDEWEEILMSDLVKKPDQS